MHSWARSRLCAIAACQLASLISSWSFIQVTISSATFSCISLHSKRSLWSAG